MVLIPFQKPSRQLGSLDNDTYDHPLSYLPDHLLLTPKCHEDGSAIFKYNSSNRTRNIIARNKQWYIKYISIENMWTLHQVIFSSIRL